MSGSAFDDASSFGGSVNVLGLSKEAAWAGGLSAQLRLIQASFADDDATGRRDYLNEEITRALKTVPPARRRTYLQALAERFPAWESAPGSDEGTAPAEEELTPEVLVARLVEVAPYLTVQQRKDFAEQLEAVGLITVRAVASEPSEPSPVSVPEELQKKLGLSSDQTLAPLRVLRLIAVLTDFSVTLDQLAWSVWRQIAPKSIVRRDSGAEGDFRKIAGPYLMGDDEVSTTQIAQVLDKTRQLIAGILAAIGSTGEVFSREFLSRLSPTSIKEMVDAESGFFTGPEQKCWRKYVELFNTVNGPAVEKEIAEIIAENTEALIFGRGRPGGTAQ